MSKFDPLVGIELTELIAQFDRVERDIAGLSAVIGAAYGPDWLGRGLRIAQLLHALKLRVEDHGYDRLSPQDRAAFQAAQRAGTNGADRNDQPTDLLKIEPALGRTSRLIAAGKMKHGATQFAALPWRIGEDGTDEVMLLTSRETRRWVIPKGWPIKGRKPAEVAAQEAYEEAGLRGCIIGKRPLGSFHYEKELSDGSVLCKVRVYLYHVECQEDDWPEKHQRVTRWFHATEAANEVKEKALGEIIRGLHKFSTLPRTRRTNDKAQKFHDPAGLTRL